ncbi:hypothetical protein [Endozoicomonas lisbonensis]|uniref:hypothetical protein n=1 Tax=Endozoicomonas lisbonensis TaxID=3120522 RepID=UPI0033930DAE
MANENDTKFMQALMLVPEELQAEFFRKNAHQIKDDSTYWNVLGTLWKLGGTVAQQELWKEMLSAPRKNSHKIMKNKERSVWRRLPNKVKAYRAINHDGEIDTAISWTLSRKIAEKFSQNGKRKVVSREFRKAEIFAYFDRRNEDEILVNLAV